MGTIYALIVRLYVALLTPPREKERGDVPGWVMITVMSAGAVAMLGGILRPELSAMLSNALNSVK